jgi:predicted dehydrogenase
MIVGGSKKMIVYDDMEPSEKIKIYDKGIHGTVDPAQQKMIRVDYRTGDMLAPKLAHREALSVEAAHLAEVLRQRSKPLCDGRQGMRIVAALEAAQRSLQEGGRMIAVEQ